MNWWFAFNRWVDSIPEPFRVVIILLLFVPAIVVLTTTQSANVTMLGVLYLAFVGVARLWYLLR